MKTLKQIIKFFFVFIAPLTAMIFYLYNINEIFSLKVPYIILWHIGILFIYFNALFYSFHMNKTKLFSRWSVTLFKGFGFIIAVDEDVALVIVIGCLGLTFRYNGLFTESNKL